MFAWPAVTAEGIGTWVAAALTLLVLSAAWGESRASRLGMALLAGAAVGYAAAVAWHAVLWPRILLVRADPLGHWPLVVWLFLGLLLLARGLTSASWLSNASLGYLFGVGAALAVGGALMGTLVPQVRAAIDSQVPGGGWWVAANALILALATGGVLLRLAYTGWSGEGAVGKAWARLAGAWGRLGYLFLLVAMGALMAAVALMALALLAARLEFLAVDWLHLVPR
jgi:hypothetical protein